MGYSLPSNTDWVTCSWQCHRDRSPCSSEPGTDYGAAYGTQLIAPATGTIVDYKSSNSNATGRYITIDADDGRRLRSLHLSNVGNIWVGMRVSQGQAIDGAKTGASGYGSDWGYGAHVHQTLWNGHSYNFCCDCTIDFALYVGSSEPAGNQRVVGPNSANGRTDANTQSPVTQTLPAGTLADFDGWKYGEAVENNNTWFRGQHSGDWFWSGGFTDIGNHDLTDLNPVTPPAGNQRTVNDGGANGRSDPSTANPPTQSLPPGTVADFDGWIIGETVQGNSTWFRGQHSGDWFWSGGFTDQGTHDLADLNPIPSPGTDRTVGSPNPANIRAYPYTTSPVTGSDNSGAVVKMKAWTHGDSVEGNDVWYQRDQDSQWQWSGGFTSQDTEGLIEVTPPTPPVTDADNPRGLPVETNYQWPLAAQWLDAPLGHVKCEEPTTEYTPRTTAGDDQHPVTPIIDTYVIHWTDSLVDQMDWFSYCNSRSSCPTTYMRRDGWQSQMIRPLAKSATTGPDWNWRSFTVETLAEPGSDFTDEQWEAHAQNIALLAEFDGQMLDGVAVAFKIDREHILGHSETCGGCTECPGEAQIAGLDALIVRAQEIYDENNPGPDPCPECPECPDPAEPIDYDRIAQDVNDEAARRRQGWT